MNYSAFTVVALLVLLGVSLAIMITLSEGLRRHRIGVTLLAAWAAAALTIYSLKALGDPIPQWVWHPWLWPTGVLLGSLAIWETSRLSRAYGTTTLIRAAELARGFLLGEQAGEAICPKWADHLPTPAWMKAPGGVMVAINRHYEKRYGTQEKTYVGSSDRDMWGHPIADQFDDNDKQVFEIGKPIVVKEAAPLWSDPSREAMILKFPVRDRRGRIVFVGGIELLIDDSCGKARDCVARASKDSGTHT